MGLIDFFKDAFKKQLTFNVVGGQNLLPKTVTNVYRLVLMRKKHGEGVVKIKGKLYYYLGSHKEQAHTRSAGKAAAGAIVGGVLTGGIGAIAGGAIGGRKKDDSTFWIDLMDCETKQEFSIQIKQIKSQFGDIGTYKPFDLSQIDMVK